MINKILSDDKNHLELFYDKEIVINTELPKWVNAKKHADKKLKNEKNNQSIHEDSNGDYDDEGRYYTMNGIRLYSPKNDDAFFDEVAEASLDELSAIISKGFISGINPIFYENNTIAFGNTGKSSLKKNGFFNNLIKKFKDKKRPSFDAREFFTNVKLASKDSADTYKNRVSGYLNAIHNAHKIGQTALVEQLIKEMVVNKYESLLYSLGMYHIIREDQIVDFIKKTENGVNLCYIKNFSRPIPNDVIEKISTINNYEIFDNYVVLYYDKNQKSYKETVKEIEKRKDPIIFGVIAGSNKLYYITDWVDEYCDLTLEKFVDTIGIKKDDLDKIE